MNDENLDSVVRRAFERQALSAPTPDSLLETVKTRSRRRALRNGTTGVAAAAVAVVGVLLGSQALPFSEPEHRSPLAPVSSGPGAFGADEIDLCLAYEGNRLAGITLSWLQPGQTETTIEESDGDPPSLGYTANGDTYGLRLDVLQAPPVLKGSERFVVDGRDGLIVEGRELYLETGVRDTLIQLTVTGAGAGSRPSDEQLIAWASKVEPSDDPNECAE